MIRQPLTRPLRLGDVTFQTAVLEPINVPPQLLVQHRNATEPFATQPGSFAAIAPLNDGVFVLCYFCSAECLSFVFDAWSETTRKHLLRARDGSGVVITLLGLDEPSFVGGGTQAFWTKAVELLDCHRASAAPRQPREYVEALNDLQFVDRQVNAIRCSVRREEGVTQAMTVVLMFDHGHADAFLPGS